VGVGVCKNACVCMWKEGCGRDMHGGVYTSARRGERERDESLKSSRTESERASKREKELFFFQRE
jgi:hypothetical protein